MSQIKETAMKVMKAWDEKDESAMRKHVHPDYISKDPMVTTVGIDNAIKKMNEFPFKGGLEIRHTIAEGNMLVVEGDWIVKEPFQAELPMVSVMKFEGDMLKEKSIYFDTAKISK